MNDHVVDYRESGHPEGMVALLLPHPRSVDWSSDGVTTEPGRPCCAISAVSDARCGKREAVVRLTARTKYQPIGIDGHDLPLCGGHFNSHRAGKEIRVIVTPGRLR